jgi:hypothetical protein
MRRRETLSPFGTSPFQHQPAILARHSGAKTMSLGSTPVVWLKSGLCHLTGSPSCAKTVRLTADVPYVKKRNRVPGEHGPSIVIGGSQPRGIEKSIPRTPKLLQPRNTQKIFLDMRSGQGIPFWSSWSPLLPRACFMPEASLDPIRTVC